MQDKTLGELVAGIARYKAQLIPTVVVLIVALFLAGARDDSNAPSSATEAAARSAGAAQQGSAGVSGALAESAGSLDAGDVAFGAGIDDLSAAGDPPPAVGSTPEDPSGPAAPAAYTCERDASLPQPVIAPVMEQLRTALPPDIASYIAGAAGCSPGVDPLTLVVAQLGPVLGAAGPVIDVLAMINPFLPPIPVPPPVNLPPLAELDPVFGALQPVTGEVCGQLAIAVIASAIVANFPLPITGQHVGSIVGSIFGICAALTPLPSE